MEQQHPRFAEMNVMFESGLNTVEIGRATGLTSARVGQIIGPIEFRNEPFKRIRRAYHFWERVDKSGGEDACWPWMGACYPTGYGRLNWTWTRGVHKTEYAHRVAWILANGPIPKAKRYSRSEMQVLHRCDNPGCVNPRHLWLGTIADNMHDRDNKGRDRFSRDPHVRARHGGIYMYTRYGCRCDACIQGAREEWRARQRSKCLAAVQSM